MAVLVQISDSGSAGGGGEREGEKPHRAGGTSKHECHLHWRPALAKSLPPLLLPPFLPPSPRSSIFASTIIGHCLGVRYAMVTRTGFPYSWILQYCVKYKAKSTVIEI